MDLNEIGLILITGHLQYDGHRPAFDFATLPAIFIPISFFLINIAGQGQFILTKQATSHSTNFRFRKRGDSTMV